MSKEFKYFCVFLLLVAILKFCFFTNTIIPPYDSYELLLLAKSLWHSHSFLIDAGLGYKFTSFHEPGYALLLALFYPVFHNFEASARFVTVMASILSVFFIYLLMEKIKKGTGKFAAFLLITSWLHLFCSSIIVRHIPSLCFIIIILYFFYGKPLSSSRTILLGILIAFASLIHLTNVALLFPFSYQIIKEKKIKKILFLLVSYGLILLPYAYMRLYKWPVGTFEAQTYFYSKELTGTLIYSYLKTIFLKFLHWEPGIFIFGLTGVILVLKNNTTRQLPGQFWGIYFLGYLLVFFVAALKIIGAMLFEDSYLTPFLLPFILAGSLYLNYLFNLKSVSTRATRWANGIITCSILVLMIINHWELKDLFVNKLISTNISGYRLIFFSSAFLFVIVCLLILFLRYNCKKLFQKIIIAGIMIAFSIQAFDEIIKIKGRHIMTTRGKELSSGINALKGKILPPDAFFVGVKDVMGIFYHTGYPLFFEDVDRLIGCHSLGKKWNTKTMARIINFSKSKPVICAYDHLYRYYLSGLGNELYECIQERYQDRLCFSNLKLNLKIYLLDNISTASAHDRFHTEAVDYYAIQLKSKPGDISLLNYLGWAYFCSGDFDAAIKKWKEKGALTDKDADVHNNLGLAYYRKGDYQQAIVEYNNALKFKPIEDPPRERWANAMIYFNLAQAYEKNQEKEKAILTWEKYYETVPYPEHKAIMGRQIKRIRGINL